MICNTQTITNSNSNNNNNNNSNSNRSDCACAVGGDDSELDQFGSCVLFAVCTAVEFAWEEMGSGATAVGVSEGVSE